MMRLFYFLTPIVLAVSAATLAFYGKEGWGWFLFVAVLSLPTTKQVK